MSPRKVRRVINALHRLGAAEAPQIRRRAGLSERATTDILTEYRGYIFCREENAGRGGASLWTLRSTEREQ